jgi:hypothetical protein
MYFSPVRSIQDTKSKGEPSAEWSQEIRNKEGEEKKVLPSQSPIKIEFFDPWAEEKNEADPYECVPKNLSFQWQPPF